MPRLADLQGDFARALLDLSAPVPDTITSHTMARPPARFAVYRRNVVAGLVQVLEGRYPVIRRLVGDDFFRAMALSFIEASPPVTPILMAFGRDFPVFVAAFEAAQDLPYLADVARLEALQHDAYHAADAPAIDVSAMAAIPQDNVARLSLVLAPSMRLMHSDYPVLKIWQTNTHDAEVKVVRLDEGADHIMILRPALVVEINRVKPGVFGLVSALAEGLRLDAAAERGVAVADDFDFTSALAGLIRSGAVVGYRL